MMRLSRPIPLLLFAKAPIPGRVKTRLTSHCSHQQAADIAKILLKEAVAKCVDFWPGEVKLAVWLDHKDAFIQAIIREYAIELLTQSVGDLGQKMHAALEQVGYPAAIMGCDVPHIEGQVLLNAYHHLSAAQNVIGKAKDGGYYLIGLTAPCRQVFDGIEWGSNRVYAATQLRAQQQAIEFKNLPLLNDVDNWQDVLELAQVLPGIQRYLSDQKLLQRK